MKFKFEEEQRQLTLLALAELALSRPGFDYALRETAKALSGSSMYDEFKRVNADRVSPSGRAPLDTATDAELAAIQIGEDEISRGEYVTLEGLKQSVGPNASKTRKCPHCVTPLTVVEAISILRGTSGYKEYVRVRAKDGTEGFVEIGQVNPNEVEILG